MLNQAQSLLTGERKLGQYQVEIARRTPNGWVPTVPPLNATVTNYRLILQPQTRRPYTPASIPSTYITQVRDVQLGRRAGVRINLKTGHQLNLFISWSRGGRLTDTITTMLTLPVGDAFKNRPAVRDLKRLIATISEL